MEKTQRMETLMEAFTQFLIDKGLNKTQERFSILKEVYTIDKCFDADELYLQMKNNSYIISRATIYNTLELLVESKLVKKHRVGNKKSFYEKC